MEIDWHKSRNIVAQAAKTNYGRYTGAVLPEMNNWAGIKVRSPWGIGQRIMKALNSRGWSQGPFNHMGVYCGVEPIGSPILDGMWCDSLWRTVKYVEDLGADGPLVQTWHNHC